MAEIEGGVLGQGGVVAVVVGNLVALTGAVNGDRGVPLCLGGVHLKGCLVGPVLKFYVIEEVEFKLRADNHLVGDTRLPHVLLGPLGDAAGVLSKALVFRLGDDLHIAGHGEGGNLHKGVQTGGFQVGDKDHVALLHGGVAEVGAVKADAVLDRILAEALHGDGDVVPAAHEIDGLEVNHPHAVFLAQGENFLNCLSHIVPQSFILFNAASRLRDTPRFHVTREIRRHGGRVEIGNLLV